MYLLLVILMLIASVLMCFIVLIQNSKGGGLASGFSSSNQIMGVRKTTDFLENKRKVDTEKVSAFFRFDEVFIYLCQQFMQSD